MSKKILVIWFSQTGQLRNIVESVTKPLSGNKDIELVFEELRPDPPFPFPWSSDQFFQAMPECVKGIPCTIQPLKTNPSQDFDLVLVAWQPWFLSPSMPAHAFFQGEAGRKLLNGKPVITIIGSRNMWVMAQNVIRKYIRDAGGKLVGNIVLCDKASNLLSVLSVIRWMFKGKKDRFMKIIPPAGIACEDIEHASGYGEVIRDALLSGNIDSVNTSLVNEGAVKVRPELVMIEKRGIVFFRLWASFILKKGKHGEKARVLRVRMFKYYLLAVLYLVSPFASLLYAVTAPFRKNAIKKQISLYQSV